MELRKRILSAAILIGCLGAGTAYVYQNPIYPIQRESDDNGAFIAYNELATEYNIKLMYKDLEYLVTLRDNQNLMAIGSTVGNYNMVDLEGTDTYVVHSPYKKRIADRVFGDEYYYDVLTGIYASDGSLLLSEDEKAETFGEYVERYGLEPDGICFPTFGKCEASEDALKTIEELYGKKVANAIREKGLPVPFYSAELIYNPNLYRSEDYDVPTNEPYKGLNK